MLFDLVDAENELEEAWTWSAYEDDALADWAREYGRPALAEIARLRAQREWVSVKERLPDEDRRIDITVRNFGILQVVPDSSYAMGEFWNSRFTCSPNPISVPVLAWRYTDVTPYAPPEAAHE